MKIPLALLASLMFVGFLTVNSYGQTSEQNTDVEIFVQVVLRNSDGVLVGYIEGAPQIFYLDKVVDWIEQRATKSIIIKDGERFEILQFKNDLSWSEPQTMGAYFIKLSINDETRTALYFHHDSFHVMPGDTAQVFVTVFRPI